MISLNSSSSAILNASMVESLAVRPLENHNMMMISTTTTPSIETTVMEQQNERIAGDEPTTDVNKQTVMTLSPKEKARALDLDSMPMVDKMPMNFVTIPPEPKMMKSKEFDDLSNVDMDDEFMDDQDDKQTTTTSTITTVKIGGGTKAECVFDGKSHKVRTHLYLF